MELDYVAIGERIRDFRQQSNLTQEKLSELCSLSTGYICHVERGTRTPSLETLAKISQILHIGLDTLVFGSVKTNEPCKTNDSLIHILSLTLKDKDEVKSKVFLKTVCALADKLDEF